MSTNYYLVSLESLKQEEKLKAYSDQVASILQEMGVETKEAIQSVKSSIINCGSRYEIHIGKSAYGWKFHLAVDNFKSLVELKEKCEKNSSLVIIDENNSQLTWAELEAIIQEYSKNPERDARSNTKKEKSFDFKPLFPVNEEGVLLVKGSFS